MAQQQLTPQNTIDFQQAQRNIRRKPVEIIPKTLGQEKFILSLLDDTTDIVIAIGPAGTGKTFLAMQSAVKALRDGQIHRIILTRPAIGVEDERHGFLPGDLISKMEPWTRPLFDVLRDYYNNHDLLTMIDEGLIEISPLAYMRGRTFKNACVIADEMQNATPSQIKMLMTRIGNNSKIIITGDVEQADRKGNNNGLLDLANRLCKKKVKKIDVIRLDVNDIQRHPLITSILNLYQD